MTIQVLKKREAEERVLDSSNGVILNNTNSILFFEYIKERHLIYKRKTIEKQLPPWTNDSILQKYKFTNVFRDLDPGTKYVIEEIIPNCDSPEDIIFNLILYRLYNKIETFNKISIQNVDKFDYKILENKLNLIKKRGIPVFTNAFTVSSYHWVSPSNDKITNTAILLDQICKDIYKITDILMKELSSEKTYKTLLKIKGIGKFLAYQISVDIGYWNKNVFNESDFVVAGPGCRRGINYIFDSKGHLNYEECIFFIENIQYDMFNQMDLKQYNLFDDREEKRLNVMAIENCFCEISKYLKSFYNKGRPRNRYVPKNTLNLFIEK